jgi:hypothetical protein
MRPTSRFYQLKTGHSHRSVPELDGKSAYYQMLVVPIQDTHTGACFQSRTLLEGPAKDTVDGSVEEDREVEEPVHYPRPPC